MREVVIGVPFNQSAGSSQQLIHSILGSRVNRLSYNVSLLFVVDSPSDVELINALNDSSNSAQSRFPIELVVNNTSIGYVNCANLIISKAIELNADLVLLNGTELFAQTAQEMLEVAESDPMIGFVSPRSNNTTICKFQMPSINRGNPADIYADFRSLSQRLPRVSYVPTADGSCVLIRANVLQNFGGFDPVFSEGYNAEADLIMRANRYGYVAAIANRAFAWHSGRDSFARANEGRLDAQRQNDAILAKRYSHYFPALHRYFESSEYRANVLISKLCPSVRPSIGFDLSSFGTLKNGTTEYGISLLRAFVKFAENKYAIAAVCTEEAWQTHELGSISGLKWSAIYSDEQFSAVVRPCQPFDFPSLAVAPSRGAVVIVSMLDPIAYDCLELRDGSLRRLWDFVMQYSDAVVYLSEFAKKQFMGRFRSNSNVQHAVAMPSTDTADYVLSVGGTSSQDAEELLLIVGNKHAHKAVRETVRMLRELLPDQDLQVLGVNVPEFPDITSFESGHLDDAFVRELYRRAKAIIFPSHYEGFGFPIMNALANRKMVFARDLPVAHEIKARVSAPENVVMFKTNKELVGLLAKADFVWTPPSRSLTNIGWERTAREVDIAVGRALESVTAESIETRLTQLDILMSESMRIKALEEGREHLTSDSIALKEERNRLQGEIDALLKSRSWRITAPIRKLRNALSGR